MGDQKSTLSHLLIYILVAICINIGIFMICILIDKFRGLITNRVEIALSNKIIKILKL